MPPVDFHVGPYDDYYNGWSTLGADMVRGPPRPDLALRPFPWLDLLGVMGPDPSFATLRPSRRQAYVTSSLATSAPWTSVGCILHDEAKHCGFAAHPNRHDVEFFRRYLQESYKDLKALNASWGTQYDNWNEVDAEPTKINFLTQGDRNPAPWADWHAASEQAVPSFLCRLG